MASLENTRVQDNLNRQREEEAKVLENTHNDRIKALEVQILMLKVKNSIKNEVEDFMGDVSDLDILNHSGGIQLD